MAYQPLVYTQTSNCIRVENNPTGCCTSEFDATFPIGLTGIMNYEEWKHHISVVNVELLRNQRAMRIAVAWVFMVSLAFAIAMATTAPTDNFAALRIIPWVFIFAILLGVFWMVRVGRKTEQSIRTLLESFNREFVPRGIQWRLHVHQHHKKRIFYLEIDVNRSNVAVVPTPAPVYASYPPTFNNQPTAAYNGQTYLQPSYPPAYAPQQTEFVNQPPSYSHV